MEEEVLAACASSLASKVAFAGDLAGVTLLQIVSQPNVWEQRPEAHEDSTGDGRRGPRFEHHMMAVEAARAGLGFALLPDFMADPLLT